VFPQNKIESSVRLSHFYRYNNKFLRVEKDASGRQWIHLSYDSEEKVLKSNYSKNYVKTERYSSIADPFSYTFTFRLSSSSKKDGIQIFHIYAFSPLNTAMCQLFFKNEILYFSIPLAFSDGKIIREDYPLGIYSFGDEVTFAFKSDGKEISLYYQGKKFFTRPLPPSLSESKASFFIASGLFPHKSATCFCEIFLTDIDF